MNKWWCQTCRVFTSFTIGAKHICCNVCNNVLALTKQPTYRKNEISQRLQASEEARLQQSSKSDTYDGTSSDVDSNAKAVQPNPKRTKRRIKDRKKVRKDSKQKKTNPPARGRTSRKKRTIKKGSRKVLCRKSTRSK